MSSDVTPSHPSLRKRALLAGSWSMAALAVSQGVRFGGNLLMTRLLVPEMFGIMLIATSVSVILALLSDIGLRQNIIQSRRGDDPIFLNTAWTVQVIRGFILFTVTALLAILAWAAQDVALWPADSTYAAPDLPMVLAFTGISAVLNGFQSTRIASAFRNFLQKKVVAAEIVAQLAGFVCMLVLGWLTRSIWALVAAGLVSAAVNAALSHLWLDGPRNRLQWDKTAIKELVAFGRWIMLSSVAGVLAAQGDRIWFGGSISTVEMGIYSIAILILGALESVVHKLMAASVLPALGEAVRNGGQGRLKELYHRIRLVVDVSLLFLCGFLFMASPAIIGFLYDDRYAGAGDMMAVLSLALFFWRYIVAHQAWLAMGRTKFLAVDSMIRCASLWLLLPVLSWLGGSAAALWGVALHTLPTLLLVFVVNHRLGLLDIRREVLVLPALLLGALTGLLL